MVRPTLQEAITASQGNTILPISCELFADIKTPIETLKNIREISSSHYLLESVVNGEKWDRYSFLGYDPIARLKVKDGLLEIDTGIKITEHTDNPSENIRNILSQYKTPKFDYLPPFTGGFVGYFGYDYVKYSEKGLTLNADDDAQFNDCELMLFDKIIAFDHLRQKIIVIVNIRTDNLETNYNRGVMELESICGMIKSTPNKKPIEAKLTTNFEMVFDKQEYCERVEKIKKHIVEGDIFQAVLSNRLEAGFEGTLLATYRVLRTINPSPYMFYIKSDSLELAGASPETIISLKNGVLNTFPIAGTKPRRKTDEEDERLIDELLHDEKELSEHNMLVDLGRNDLGKISEFGSVNVSDYKKPLKFSHVIHITSTVTGKIKRGYDQLDAINAVLPAGTLSGAPKRRAMEILNGLEPKRRGIYGGAVGYIDFAGNMDMCIAIRMAVHKGGKVYVQSGAGIVADSIPQIEFAECANKAGAMVEALKNSEEAVY